MTPDQKLLVRDTWNKVIPDQEHTAELFYQRLFAQNPELKGYFKGDMKEQGRKLMVMINAAVCGLDQLDSLLEPIKRMGARHHDYGVKDEDYDKVGAALLWTLAQELGPSFTPKVEAAWTLTYATVANVMKSGAAEAEAA